MSAISSQAHGLVGKLYKHCYTTFQHSLRVGNELYQFSRYLGLENTEQIYILGILHDIGKLDISSSLLNKITPLTSEEFDSIKRHTEHGFKRIKEIRGLPSNFALYAKYHHEDFDGKGYYGLSGEQIPLLSRMIRIVDSYDTMTKGRPYQSPIEKARVIHEIQSLSDKQFDGMLLNYFFEYLQDKHVNENTLKLSFSDVP
ncbi:hypothetical protein AWM68_17865 [Fictibacillus phosphorivorans]|uniref:HD-GYP domain-containing protein n=1 Tax=Fictibacillus phosphorivorans TaxID=1221500 RepID=A0A163S346_9BACL|nr:HD domain-containing phosphohydrolase [Fictibacillus phosphorivorans]KZE68037.1 hypothetical protein AWM68_17865 [Fictibacillus phosphorivorans]